MLYGVCIRSYTVLSCGEDEGYIRERYVVGCVE
jgi:hypothetical protein